MPWCALFALKSKTTLFVSAVLDSPLSMDAVLCLYAAVKQHALLCMFGFWTCFLMQ